MWKRERNFSSLFLGCKAKNVRSREIFTIEMDNGISRSILYSEGNTLGLKPIFQSKNIEYIFMTNFDLKNIKKEVNREKKFSKAKNQVLQFASVCKRKEERRSIKREFVLIRTVGGSAYNSQDICIGQTRNKCHQDISSVSQLASQNFSLAISLAEKMGYAINSQYTYDLSQELCTKCKHMKAQPCQGVLNYQIDTYQVDNTKSQEEFKL